MPGHGSQLLRKQEEAISALLTERTVEEAAAKARVKYRTLKSWLAQPAFQAAYREARRQILERTLGRLLALHDQAADTLERNLSCGNPAVEIRAAVAILEHAWRGTETLDLAEEINHLKERLDHDHGNPRPRSGPAQGEAGRNGTTGPPDSVPAAS